MPCGRRAVVGVGVVRVRGGDVRAGRRDEGRLVHSVGDALRPLVQRLPEGGDVALDVVEDAEVDERDAGGPAPLELVERPFPRLEVDLRRRRGGEDEPSGRDSDAGASPL